MKRNTPTPELTNQVAMKALWKQEWAVAALLIFVLAGMGYGLLWRKGEILYSPHSDIIAQGFGGKTVLMIILCRQPRRANVKAIDYRKLRTKKSNMVQNKGIVDA